MVILIIGILAAIALPAFLEQQLKAQDSNGEVQRPQHGLADRGVLPGHRRLHRLHGELTAAATGLPLGMGPGRSRSSPRASSATRSWRTRAATAAARTTPSPSPTTSATSSTPLRPRGKGGCPADGRWWAVHAVHIRPGASSPSGRTDPPSMAPVTHFRREGFTLVELMAASLVLVIGMLGASASSTGLSKTSPNQARMGGHEPRPRDHRGRPLDGLPDLTPTSTAARSRPTPGCRARRGAWKVQRGGTEYTIATRGLRLRRPGGQASPAHPAPDNPVHRQPGGRRRATPTATTSGV